MAVTKEFIERMYLMNKKLTFTGANIFFLVFTLVFLAYQMILGFFMGSAIYDKMFLIITINELGILAFVLIYCLIKKINIKEAFRFNNPGFLPMVMITIISLPAIFVASMLNSLVIYFLQFIGDVPASTIPVPQNAQELLLGLLVVAVLPGICEELMHRGLLLRAYERRGSYKAVAVIAVFFGLFHFDITNLLGPIFLGLIIGYYVIRTNSIYAGIYAHFLNNMISVLVQYLSKAPQAETLAISEVELVSSVVFGIISLAITIGLLYVFKKVTQKRAVVVAPIARVGQDIKAVLSHWPIIIVIVLYFLMTMLYILSILFTKVFGM